MLIPWNLDPIQKIGSHAYSWIPRPNSENRLTCLFMDDSVCESKAPSDLREQLSSSIWLFIVELNKDNTTIQANYLITFVEPNKKDI